MNDLELAEALQAASDLADFEPFVDAIDFREAIEEGLNRDVVFALKEKVRAADDRLAILALAALARLDCVLPTSMFQPDRYVELDDLVEWKIQRVGLDEHLARCCEMLDSGDARVRVSAAHLMARFRRVQSTHFEALLDCLEHAQDDAKLIGTLGVSLGIMAYRLNMASSSHAVIDRLGVLLEHRDALVMFGAAVGLSFAVEAVDVDTLGRLVAETITEAPLPEEWCWFDHSDSLNSRSIGFHVLTWVRVQGSPTRSLERLLAHEKTPGRVLVHCAFESNGGSPIALDELSSQQRCVLVDSRLHDGTTPHGVLVRLGFSPFNLACEVDAFLEAKEPRWIPLFVTSERGPKAWHFRRLLIACAQGMLPEPLALELSQQLAPDAALALATQWDSYEGVFRTIAERQRCNSLCLQLVRAVHKRQLHAVEAYLAEALAVLDDAKAFGSAGFSLERVLTAMCDIRCSGTNWWQDDSARKLVARSLTVASAPEPLREILQSSPQDVRCQLMAAPSVEYGIQSKCLFWETCPSPELDHAVVECLCDPQAGYALEDRVELLAKRGTGVMAKVEPYRAQNPKLHQALIARFGAR